VAVAYQLHMSFECPALQPFGQQYMLYIHAPLFPQYCHHDVLFLATGSHAGCQVCSRLSCFPPYLTFVFFYTVGPIIPDQDICIAGKWHGILPFITMTTQ